MRKAAALLFAMALLGGTGAKADDIVFACAGAKECKDNIKQSDTNYSTLGDGIQVFDVLGVTGPYDSKVTFELAFNTADSTISLDGTKGKGQLPDYTGQDLVGTITGFSATDSVGTTALAFAVFWPTLPEAVQTWLGSATGTGSVTVIEDTRPESAKPKGNSPNKVGQAESASVVITPLSGGGGSPVPEPGSLLLFGSGLVAVCGAVRRRLGK